MFISIQMPLVSPPPIGVIPRDAKGVQQRLQVQKNAIFPPPKDLRQYLATAMVNSMP
jgi:hypothetical protein